MGYLRFFLVIAVVYVHFEPFTGLWWYRYIPVFALFSLSGFLITQVVCEVYEDSLRGRAFYLINRCVRVYPIYFSCLIIAILITALYPAVSEPSRGLYFAVPSTWYEWFRHATILGLNGFSAYKPRPVLLEATAWSLSTEIAYYMVIGLITGRSRHLTLLAFVASIAMMILLKQNNASFIQYYFTMHGPSPIFFLGSLGYHYRHTLKKYLPAYPLLLLLIANLMLYLPRYWGPFRTVLQEPFAIFLYITACVFTLIIVCLYEACRHKAISKLEQFLADISYPLFLIHWPIGALIVHYIDIKYWNGYGLFFSGLLISALISATLVFFVEMPLKKIRKYFRKRGIKSANSTN